MHRDGADDPAAALATVFAATDDPELALPLRWTLLLPQNAVFAAIVLGHGVRRLWRR